MFLERIDLVPLVLGWKGVGSPYPNGDAPAAVLSVCDANGPTESQLFYNLTDPGMEDKLYRSQDGSFSTWSSV